MKNRLLVLSVEQKRKINSSLNVSMVRNAGGEPATLKCYKIT